VNGKGFEHQFTGMIIIDDGVGFHFNGATINVSNLYYTGFFCADGR
jgi:hypothetical protein